MTAKVPPKNVGEMKGKSNIKSSYRFVLESEMNVNMNKYVYEYECAYFHWYS